MGAYGPGDGRCFRSDPENKLGGVIDGIGGGASTTVAEREGGGSEGVCHGAAMVLAPGFWGPTAR